MSDNITLPRAVVEQALEAMRRAVPTGKITLYEWDRAISDLSAALAMQRLTDAQQEMERSIESLKAALAQQAEPGPGKVVAWGVFALADGEWQLQHPVFVGDECGKENAEFERASYSGPQPLEVRPLGVVTALAQQAKPVEPVYWEVRCTAHPKWMWVDEQQFDEYVSYGWEGQRLYTAPPPCPTCQSLARTVMMDQMGKA